MEFEDYPVIFVEEKFKLGYIGMNSRAKNYFNIPFPYSEDTVVIYRHLSERTIKNTIHHEIIELNLMRDYNLHYKTAHQWALKYEQSKLPLSEILEIIREKLKR